MNLYSNNPLVDFEVTRLLGLTVADLLRNPRTTDITCDYDVECDAGVVRADQAGEWLTTGTTIPADAVRAATLLLAGDSGQSIPPEATFLTCALACGACYHGGFEPARSGPHFSIRVHGILNRPLSDFATPEQAERLREMVRRGDNILIGGATGSGKTSLLNALINEIDADERLLVLEDARELEELITQSGIHKFVVFGRASGSVTLKRQVFETLRDRPDRIIVGEVRDASAYDMLDSFTTGHSGGLATVHAPSAEKILTRLARLAQCGEQLIHEAIDVAVYVKRMPDGRRAVMQIKELNQ